MHAENIQLHIQNGLSPIDLSIGEICVLKHKNSD